MGTIDPASVYNHADAVAHPWKWAGIHAAFVTAAGVAGVTSWRLNERARSETARAHEKARDSEQRFRKGFDSSPIGMALASPDGHFVRVNDALCEITGYSREGLLERGFADITHPDDLQASLDYVSRIVEGEIDSYETEKRYLRKDGEIVFGHVNISTVGADDGSALYFVAQIEDVTELRRVQAELDESQALHRVVIESSYDALAVLDLDGTIRLASRSIENTLGYTQQDLVGGEAEVEVRDALHDDAVIRQLRDLAALAFVVATNDDDLITDLKAFHHSTSGASEMIFMNFFERSSRATGPKMRVPTGSCWALIKTALLSSNLM